MFYFKKLKHQVKWLYKVKKINRKVLSLYFMNTLDYDIKYEKENEKIEFSRDCLIIKMNKTNCEFYISKTNNVSFAVRFYDEDRQSKTFISKFLIFIDDVNITDNETLYYADQIISRVERLLNEAIEDLLFKDKDLMEKYLKMNDGDLKNLRKKELINDFIPKDLKCQYLNATLDKDLKKEHTQQKVSKI